MMNWKQQLGGLLMSLAASLAQGQTLTLTHPVAAELPREAPIRVALEAAPGDYLRGHFLTANALADLTLVSASGHPVRQLVAAGDERRQFQFVVDAADQVLEVRGYGGGGRFELTLDRQVPVASQQAPEREFLSPTIAEVARVIADGGDTEAFWQQVARAGTPLVEPGPDGRRILTFLYRGAERNVRLFGAPSSNHEQLARLGQSDIWFRSFEAPDSTRLSYQLAPDVPDLPGTARERRVAILATAKADPLNLTPWPADAVDVYQQNSTVTLDKAPPQPWLSPGTEVRGSLETLRFASEALGNQRDIQIYRSAGFDPANPDHLLLLVFDGDAYTSQVPTPTILDNLVAAGELPAVMAVFIGNPDREARSRELPANPLFARVLAQELVPWLQHQTGMEPLAERTILAGSSYGGLASATVALAYPEVFGNVLSMSGSFWWHPPGTPAHEQEYVARQLVGMDTVPVRFFLSAGLFEGHRSDMAGILETSRHLRDLLAAKGFPVRHREYAAGHDYFAWQGVLAAGLLALADMANWQPAR